MRIRAVLSVSYVVCGLLMAGAAAAQDIGNGESISRQWCANCHQVDRSSPRGSDAVPSFPAIARMPSTTEMSLAAFLSSSHGRMPDYSLTRQEIRDVSAYIVSLRDPPATGR